MFPSSHHMLLDSQAKPNSILYSHIIYVSAISGTEYVTIMLKGKGNEERQNICIARFVTT
jgi:hypothetical protein